MKIYLVRHGRPKPESEDPLKGLSEEGRDEVSKIASYANRHLNIKVEQIYHSGKARAKETAEIFATQLEFSSKLTKTKNLNPNDNTTHWVENIKKTKTDMMIVGHMPFLSNLASSLLCDNLKSGIFSFETCTILCLRNGEFGRWFIDWMISPSIIE